MSNLPIFRWRELTDAGAVLNGGKLYFYAAGGTTPKATYPTQADQLAGTNANANPVVADAYGRFGEIWLIPNSAYRVILKDSAGTTIYDEDDQYANQLSDDFIDQQYETAENPNHYGALGTGSADETADVQQAIDAAVANSRSGVVDLMGRTYRCDSTLSITSGITLRNGKLNFASSTSDYLINVLGSFASNNLLTGNATIGDTTLALTNVTNIAVGSRLKLSSADSGNPAEMVTVIDIDSLTVTLSRPIVASYTTASAAKVNLLTPVTNVRLENLIITGSAGNAGAGWVVSLDGTVGAVVDDISILSADNGVRLINSSDARIENVRHAQDQDSATATFILVDNTDGARLDNCSCRSVTNGIVLGSTGFATGISITGGNIQKAATYGISASAFSHSVNISSTLIKRAGTGVYIGGVGVVVRDGCSIQATAWGIDITDADWSYYIAGTTRVRSLKIDGNVIDAASASGGCIRMTSDASQHIEGVRITENSMFGPIGIDLNFSGTTEMKDWTVERNRYRRDAAANYFFDLVQASGSLEMIGVAVDNNRVDGSIRVANDALSGYYNNVSMSGNFVTASTSSAGVRFLGFNGVAVSTGLRLDRNTIVAVASSTYGGVHFEQTPNGANGLSGVSVCGNIVTGAAAGSAIRVDTQAVTGGVTSGLSVSGNMIHATCAVGINLIGSYVYGASVCDNTVYGVDNGGASNVGILINGSATPGYRLLSVTGNAILSGNRGVKITGYASILTVGGNAIEGSATISEVLSLAGDAAGSVHTVAVSGNSLSEGVNAIATSNTALVVVDGNSAYSQSTGLAATASLPASGGIMSTFVNITATEIVGNSAGDLNHASGVALVAAPGAGLIVVPIAIVVDFAYATGQYGDGGGNLVASYDSGAVCSDTVSTLTTVGAAASNIAILHPVGGLAVANTALVLRATAAMTAGAGAGTAQIRTFYRLVDA